MTTKRVFALLSIAAALTSASLVTAPEAEANRAAKIQRNAVHRAAKDAAQAQKHATNQAEVAARRSANDIAKDQKHAINKAAIDARRSLNDGAKDQRHAITRAAAVNRKAANNYAKAVKRVNR